MTLPLTPESRPSADAETRLQGFVFPSVLDGRPDEEADDKSRGENYEDGDHDRCCDIHVKRCFPTERVSNPARARQRHVRLDWDVGRLAARTNRRVQERTRPRARARNRTAHARPRHRGGVRAVGDGAEASPRDRVGTQLSRLHRCADLRDRGISCSRSDTAERVEPAVDRENNPGHE